MQDVPYAIFGTCLGAITAYELVHCALAAGKPPPVKLFTAAVSPPHLYAQAVAQLYLAPEQDKLELPELISGVLHKLRDWEQLPKELIMQVWCHMMATTSMTCMFQWAIAHAGM